MNATRSEHFTLDRVSKVYTAGQLPQFDQANLLHTGILGHVFLSFLKDLIMEI